MHWGIYEPEGGFLTARVACQAVLDGFLAEGGEYKQAGRRTCAISTAEVGQAVSLRWLEARRPISTSSPAGRGWENCFRKPLGNRVRPTKQDVFFFGTPAGDERFTETKLPVWADHRDRFIYGIPGNQGRGFKVADDTRGPEFDPTSGERTVSAEGLKIIRDYIAFRFPALKDAPLLESRVCQYENSPDNNFIIDRHPRHENVWLLGGGSGHGFKHGPALGEMVAGLVLEHKDPDALFRLADSANVGRRRSYFPRKIHRPWLRSAELRSAGQVDTCPTRPCYWIWMTLSPALALISSTRVTTLRAKSIERFAG